MNQRFGQRCRSLSFVFVLGLGLNLATQAAVNTGQLRVNAAAVGTGHRKYIRVATPLPAAKIAKVEFLISLPRVANTYGHTAFRLTFRGGQQVEAGFIVGNFQQGAGNASGNGPMFLELMSTGSTGSMNRLRQFKVAYAEILLSPSEQQSFVELLNEIAARGLDEQYEIRSNNCATAATKALNAVVQSRRAPIVSKPEDVVPKYARAGLVDRAVANGVEDLFNYYEKNPYDPGTPKAR